MTPNLLLLNVLSLALVCLLALFARHNKKVGWVKTRSTFVEDLRTLQQDWAEQDQQAALPQTVAAPVILPVHASELAPITHSNFATQLASLHTALKDTAPQVEVFDVMAETNELAPR